MRYSIDTSSLVESWNRAYPRDVFPTLWDDHLPSLISAGDLRATQEVFVELERQDDLLLAWAKNQADFFVEVDGPVQEAVKDILSKFALIDPHRGRSGGDPFVIALAEVNGATVVSEEKPKPSKPKIPDVCSARRVRHINLLDLMREQGWSYRA